MWTDEGHRQRVGRLCCGGERFPTQQAHETVLSSRGSGPRAIERLAKAFFPSHILYEDTPHTTVAGTVLDSIGAFHSHTTLSQTTRSVGAIYKEYTSAVLSRLPSLRIAQTHSILFAPLHACLRCALRKRTRYSLLLCTNAPTLCSSTISAQPLAPVRTSTLPRGARCPERHALASSPSAFVPALS